MQPVLSRAMRMVAGRDHIDEQALADLAEEIKNDPTVTEAFPEDDAVLCQAGARDSLPTLLGAPSIY